ncbi:hypothetical protein LVW23_16125 [Klebsiella pneumoniae]|nr:hypothetical protein [Klebsiella pneumoniae]
MAQEMGGDHSINKAGMNNQSRGRTGNRLLSASLTDQALNIIRERYADFGPTLTWEKLAENHGLLMSL